MYKYRGKYDYVAQEYYLKYVLIFHTSQPCHVGIRLVGGHVELNHTLEG